MAGVGRFVSGVVPELGGQTRTLFYFTMPGSDDSAAVNEYVFLAENHHAVEFPAEYEEFINPVAPVIPEGDKGGK